MPRNSAPHTYRVDEERKDQGWALLDGGSHRLTKKVTRRGEVLVEQRTWEDYVPLHIVLILFIVSQGL
jgi:hypothetical protein